MRFYYISIVSLILLGVIYALGTALLAGIWYWLRQKRRIGIVMVPLFLLLYVGPWVEELWIAYNFGQLCRKDAGKFIYRAVEVKGFYDDTSHWWRQLADSDFEFVESREHGRKAYWRVERNGSHLRHFAIAHPTARFHYTRDIYGARVAYKITRQESRVTDSATGEVLGRYVEYGRGPYWFFIGLDQYPYSCDGPDGGPTSKHNSLIYRDVLKPSR
jgi:hypothetical protein